MAAAVGLTFALLILLSHEHLNWWWLLPIVFVGVLGLSLRRAATH